MILEICANSLESALTAQRAGAQRIELCTALSLGGLTPSFGLIEQTKDLLDIPIMVLIRPRSGNFTYTETEWKVLLKDIDTCRKLGVDGIVCGALTKEQRIDKARTQELLKASAGMDFTFHRAFDWTSDPYTALDVLIELQVPRLLTSGQQANAEKGLPLLKELQEKSQGAIHIMPGGGINASNAKLFKEAGFTQIHCSASEKFQSLEQPPKVSMEGALEEGVISVSSEEKIREILKHLA